MGELLQKKGCVFNSEEERSLASFSTVTVPVETMTHNLADVCLDARRDTLAWHVFMYLCFHAIALH